MSDRQQLETILKFYYKPPYQPAICLDKLLDQPHDQLNAFIKNEIVPEVKDIKSSGIQDVDKKIYIKNLKEALKELGFIKKKKKTYKQIMNDMLKQKKTDEEYFEENKKKLQKELVKTVVCKIEKL